MDVKTMSVCMDWSKLAQNMIKLKAVVNKVVKIWFS
jgi:hypothetical protein